MPSSNPATDFIGVIEDAKRAFASWPQWMQNACRSVLIHAPGDRGLMFLENGRYYPYPPPHWGSDEGDD